MSGPPAANVPPEGNATDPRGQPQAHAHAHAHAGTQALGVTGITKQPQAAASPQQQSAYRASASRNVLRALVPSPADALRSLESLAGAFAGTAESKGAGGSTSSPIASADVHGSRFASHILPPPAFAATTTSDAPEYNSAAVAAAAEYTAFADAITSSPLPSSADGPGPAHSLIDWELAGSPLPLLSDMPVFYAKNNSNVTDHHGGGRSAVVHDVAKAFTTTDAENDHKDVLALLRSSVYTDTVFSNDIKRLNMSSVTRAALSGVNSSVMSASKVPKSAFVNNDFREVTSRGHNEQFIKHKRMRSAYADDLFESASGYLAELGRADGAAVVEYLRAATYTDDVYGNETPDAGTGHAQNNDSGDTSIRNLEAAVRRLRLLKRHVDQQEAMLGDIWEAKKDGANITVNI